MAGATVSNGITVDIERIDSYTPPSFPKNQRAVYSDGNGGFVLRKPEEPIIVRSRTATRTQFIDRVLHSSRKSIEKHLRTDTEEDWRVVRELEARDRLKRDHKAATSVEFGTIHTLNEFSTAPPK